MPGGELRRNREPIGAALDGAAPMGREDEGAGSVEDDALLAEGSATGEGERRRGNGDNDDEEEAGRFPGPP